LTLTLSVEGTMGRVARFKKIKACDKFSKQNRSSSQSRESEYLWGTELKRNSKKRSLVATKLRASKLKRRRKGGATIDDEEDAFDVPPDGKDEFNLSDLIGSIKKEKPAIELESFQMQSLASRETTPKNSSNTPKLDGNETKLTRELNKDIKSSKTVSNDINSKIEGLMEGRREGESMRAFEKRLKEDTRIILENNMKEHGNPNANPEKMKRRKEFLNKKKEKKRKGKRLNIHHKSQYTDLDQDDQDDLLITGEMAAAASETHSFLDQVERPPMFEKLPRGANPKETLKKQDSIQRKDGVSMTKEEVQAEIDAMEIMRKKVQAQYSLLKTKRRKEGMFHL